MAKELENKVKEALLDDNFALAVDYYSPPIFPILLSLALFILILSLLYILKCLLFFKMIKFEFLHHVGVNYLFALWISWLLLLESSPFMALKSSLTWRCGGCSWSLW
ncbi:hypothetical protein AHAS_Ahas04G0150800 [Arachis hypogaea]